MQKKQMKKEILKDKNFLRNKSNLGPLQTRYFCTQYWDKKILQSNDKIEPQISMTNQGKLL
jgi:hypothetical protein